MNDIRHSILFFLLMPGLFASAQKKVDFRDAPFADILQMAKAQKKPVLYMCYASWCSHCAKMKAEVIIDPTVADFYDANFVCGWHDMELGEGVSLRKRFHVKSYPTFVVTDSDGNILYVFGGELTAEQFIAEGKNALDRTKQLPTLRDNFNADPANPEKALNYVAALRKSNLDTEPAAHQYLSSVAENNMITATNWKIIANGVRDIDAPEFRFVLKNQEAFARVSSAKRVERKIVNVVDEALTPYVEASDTLNYFRKRPAAAAIALHKTDSMLFELDRKILSAVKNWKDYRKAVEKSISFSWNSQQQLREISTSYLENIDDKKALAVAASWAARSDEIHDDKQSLIIGAKLWLKAGNKENAMKMAAKANDQAVKYNWDTAETQALLKQISEYKP